MLQFLRKLFGIRHSTPALMPDWMEDYTREEIQTVSVLMGTEEQPGPLRTAVIKFVNRQVETQIGMMRGCVSSQDWSRASIHEGQAQAFQAIVFELENIAARHRVSRPN